MLRCFPLNWKPTEKTKDGRLAHTARCATVAQHHAATTAFLAGLAQAAGHAGPWTLAWHVLLPDGAIAAPMLSGGESVLDVVDGLLPVRPAAA